MGLTLFLAALSSDLQEGRLKGNVESILCPIGTVLSVYPHRFPNTLAQLVESDWEDPLDCSSLIERTPRMARGRKETDFNSAAYSEQAYQFLGGISHDSTFPVGSCALKQEAKIVYKDGHERSLLSVDSTSVEGNLSSKMDGLNPIAKIVKEDGKECKLGGRAGVNAPLEDGARKRRVPESHLFPSARLCPRSREGPSQSTKCTGGRILCLLSPDWAINYCYKSHYERLASTILTTLTGSSLAVDGSQNETQIRLPTIDSTRNLAQRKKDISLKSRVSIPSLVLLTRTGFPTTVSWRYLPRNPRLASSPSGGFPWSDPAESPVVERSGKGHRPLDRTDGIVGFTCHPLKVSTSAACFVWSLHEERAGNGLILILYSFQNRNFTHIVLMPEVCFAASSITALWPKREPSLTHLASKGRRKARSGQLVTNIREAEPPSSDISNSETTLLSFLRHRKQNYLTEGDSRKGRGIRMRSERPSLGQTMQ
ncbi:hypothetical protein SLEP1_g58986 [Rubroshorea leprosula]|uniref:Uncharacterized protein n=1 Tax=Rubroshorea leprosula TaxID=152421 RepID=A0AAV5MR10_9ROSI|nr:hypothetical protein SLEP1_g58986 [Rubroshorea leprosula]